MFGWLKRKPKERDEIDVLFDAVDEVNRQWRRMPRNIRLWIDWENQEILVQRRTFSGDVLDRDELRRDLKASGHLVEE